MLASRAVGGGGGAAAAEAAEAADAGVVAKMAGMVGMAEPRMLSNPRPVASRRPERARSCTDESRHRITPRS